MVGPPQGVTAASNVASVTERNIVKMEHKRLTVGANKTSYPCIVPGLPRYNVPVLPGQTGDIVPTLPGAGNCPLTAPGVVRGQCTTTAPLGGQCG